MMKNLESQTEKLGLEFEGHKKALWALELRIDNVKTVAIVVGFDKKLRERLEHSPGHQGTKSSPSSVGVCCDP